MNTDRKEGGILELKEDLERIIEALSLDDLSKTFLKSRWLDQVVWVEKAAKRNQRYYYLLRLACIIGGVIIPGLVGLMAGGRALPWGQWATAVLSLIVAISAAIEEFFHFGERWRHYRRLAEHLKAEGWAFFQLTGGYNRHNSHVDAYSEFAGRIEEALQKEVAIFISKVTAAKSTDKDQSGV